MRNSLLLSTLLLSALTLIGTSASFAQSNPEEEVRQAMADNVNAQIHRDAAALQRQYADDYYRIGVTGRVWDKAAYMKAVMGPEGGQSRKLDRSDVKIRIFGNVAVATGFGSLSGEGNSAPRTSQFLEVWVKRNGNWQKTVASYTSTTPLPASAYQH